MSEVEEVEWSEVVEKGGWRDSELIHSKADPGGKGRPVVRLPLPRVDVVWNRFKANKDR